MLRKLIIPFLVLLVLPAIYLALAVGFPDLLQTLLGAVPGRLAASGAEIVAGQQASGFVPFAVIGSKLLTFCTTYAVLTLWPWALQGFTHPAPTRWAKGPARGTQCTPANSYSAAFMHLDPVEKFTVYQRLQLSIVIRAAAAVLFAALVV